MLHTRGNSCGKMENMTVKRERSLTDQVMDYVRDAVLRGDMSADKWYSVYQLSEELGISRSPVRDGLLRLEEAGLVAFARNRGFQVVETRAGDVAEIFSLRLGIEPAAAYRAALHHTTDDLAETDALVTAMAESAQNGDEEEFFRLDRILHELILQMGRNRRAVKLIAQLRTHTRLLGASTAGDSRSLQDILDEHAPILKAIRERDAAGAYSSMHHHLGVTGRLLLAQALRRQGSADSENAVEAIWTKHTGGQ